MQAERSAEDRKAEVEAARAGAQLEQGPRYRHEKAATVASQPMPRRPRRKKICSAGCGLAENARMFSKKQWSARAPSDGVSPA